MLDMTALLVTLLLALQLEEAEEELTLEHELYEREEELDELDLLLLLQLEKEEEALTLDEVDSTAEAVGFGLGRKLSLVCLSLRWGPAGHFGRQYYAEHLHKMSSRCLTESSNHEVVGIGLVVGDLRFVREVCP